MNKVRNLFFLIGCLAASVFISCKEDGFGANPFDPETPVTVSQLPKVLSFEPAEGKAGTFVEIKGVNFRTATGVAFGGKTASSFEVTDDSTIVAVVSPYGASGPVAVTNHKGTRSLEGFRFIKEIVPDDGGNMAVKGKASGSVAVEGAIGNINDGKSDTFWKSAAGENVWVQIDLGRIKAFNTVRMVWEPSAPALEYELSVSRDGKKFVTVQTLKGRTGVSKDGVDNLYFEERDARYIRLSHMKNPNAPGEIVLKELGIYSRYYENFAKGKLTSASSFFYPVANLVIGNKDFFWAAKNVGDQWVKIDLGEELKFNNIDLFWGVKNFAKTTRVEISYDDDTYTEVMAAPEWAPSPDAAVYDMQRLVFPETEARYVKFSFVEGTIYTLWCYEIEIYNR